VKVHKREAADYHIHKPLLRFKPKPLGKRKRVTLIAAFRCQWGAVICADTQETAGQYRVSVDKIAPSEVGEYELVIGGAGNSGGLIDDFTENFARSVESWPAGLSEQDIRLKIRRALFEFHRDEVAYFPAAPDDKRLEFIICIQPNLKKKIGGTIDYNNLPNPFLWRTDGTSLVTVRDYALLGFEDAIYKHEVKRLYTPQIAMAQAVMLCVNLLSMAKATSNYIGGETQLITVRVGGMTLVDSSHVSNLEQRTATFNQALAELVLACPDLSIRNDEFQDLLTNFGKRVMQLREQYLELALTEELDAIQRDAWQSTRPYPATPGGMLIRGSDGKPELIPPEQIEGFIASLPAAKKLQSKIEKKQAAKKKQSQKSRPRKSKGQQ
jgi:20S proteasome alpha/beta subunit